MLNSAFPLLLFPFLLPRKCPAQSPEQVSPSPLWFQSGPSSVLAGHSTLAAMFSRAELLSWPGKPLINLPGRASPAACLSWGAVPAEVAAGRKGVSEGQPVGE